jgi:zinc-finger of transposase IS204/IS1001/IS1096/IS1165
MEGSPFLPLSDGLHIERVTASANELRVQVLSSSPKACCPLCGTLAWRIHSRYTRQVADLPCVGQHVTLLLIVCLLLALSLHFWQVSLKEETLCGIKALVKLLSHEVLQL